MKKLSAAFLTLVLVSACGGGSGGSSSGAAGGGNSAPLITSGNTYSVAEGATSIGTVSASDVDGDNLTFSLSGADAGVISIGSTSGALSFNSPADFENPADDGGDNVYNVTARVGDGSAFDARDLVITVTNNNDAPVITSGGAYTITENVTVIGSVDASDSDGDTLSYTLSGDDASLMTVSSSGALAFIAAPDFEAPADTGADNVYNASVAVSDGTDTVSQAITVTVTDLEEATTSSELFISEYSEGSSNNKYIEIFNGTGADVSLDGYAWPANAAPSAEDGVYEFWNTFTAGAVVANNDVYVVCNGSLDASVAGACDQEGSVFFNGDDGVALVKGTEESFTVVDVVGTWSSTDPGDGYEVCGVADGTKDHTLIKKEKTEGNAGDWTASAGTNADDCDWIVQEQNYWSDLGQHCWDSEFAAESIVINNASGEVSVAENGTSVATVSTTVSACGSVAYSLTGDDAALFTISATGVVEFAAAPDFEAPGDTGADNVYNFNVVATNGSASDSLAMVVTVTDVNEDIPTYSGQVYISEYAEGSSNNKYLEIFNGTDGTINLDNYSMANASNGANVAGTYDFWNPFTAGATLGKGQVWVVCHPSADATILAECDQQFVYLSNGDDGFAIVEGTEDSYTVLDRVGDWGADDPGDGWEVCGVADGTKDHTLVKKSDKYGTDDWSVSAGTNAEDCYWEVKAQNVWDGVGSHTETEPEGPDATAYCNAPVTHFGIEAETASAVSLTIKRVDANNVDVIVTSTNDDPVDLVLVGAQRDPAGVSAMVLENGIAKVTLTWNDGAPESTSFEVLWSKESSGGNWMLTQEQLGEIDTSDATSDCEGPTPPPASGLSLTVSADATEVRMTGPWWGWDPAGGPIATDNGDGTFTVTLDSVPTESFEYLWVADTVQENLVAAAAAGECAAEYDAGAFVTDFAGYANRKHLVGSGNVTDDVYGACDGTDTGGGTGGGTDGGIVATMTGLFDGMELDEATSTYTFPSTAMDWAGVSNDNADLYPIKFTEAGRITFTAAAPNGNVDVRFKFERLPYDTEGNGAASTLPDYNTAVVTVSGNAEQTYEVDVPSQGTNEFRSFLMFLDTRDVGVVVKDVTVFADAREDTGGGASGGGTMVINEPFGGSTIDTSGKFVEVNGTRVEGNVYEIPTGSADWAGFAHDPTLTDGYYPIVIPNGATITARMAKYFESDPVHIYFGIEPGPNQQPRVNTDQVEVQSVSDSNGNPVYTFDIPAQGTTEFRNFLFYIVERDARIMLESVTITPK